jgi:hypothetical protein
MKDEFEQVRAAIGLRLLHQPMGKLRVIISRLAESKRLPYASSTVMQQRSWRQNQCVCQHFEVRNWLFAEEVNRMHVEFTVALWREATVYTNISSHFRYTYTHIYYCVVKYPHVCHRPSLMLENFAVKLYLEYVCFLRYSAVQSGESQLTYQGNVSAPSPVPKSNSGKVPVWSRQCIISISSTEK